MAVHLVASGRIHVSLLVHHALLDGWSAQQFINELLSNYQRLLDGELPAARAVPPSPAMLIDFERKALASDSDRAFWQRELRGAQTSVAREKSWVRS
jgi:hypothetical protein